VRRGLEHTQPRRVQRGFKFRHAVPQILRDLSNESRKGVTDCSTRETLNGDKRERSASSIRSAAARRGSPHRRAAPVRWRSTNRGHLIAWAPGSCPTSVGGRMSASSRNTTTGLVCYMSDAIDEEFWSPATRRRTDRRTPGRLRETRARAVPGSYKTSSRNADTRPAGVDRIARIRLRCGAHAAGGHRTQGREGDVPRAVVAIRALLSAKTERKSHGRGNSALRRTRRSPGVERLAERAGCPIQGIGAPGRAVDGGHLLDSREAGQSGRDDPEPCPPPPPDPRDLAADVQEPGAAPSRLRRKVRSRR